MKLSRHWGWWFAAAAVVVAAGWLGTEVREARPSGTVWVECGSSIGSAALLHLGICGAEVSTHSAVVVQREALVRRIAGSTARESCCMGRVGVLCVVLY